MRPPTSCGPGLERRDDVMMNTSLNLRKAAVLLRSVDADTAATLLAQLSADEAAALREAMRGLGPVDADEQREVLTDFRRQKPQAEPLSRGVELTLSSPQPAAKPVTAPSGKRFEFLESAPAKTLAIYLAREHAQTIAVVLSHLPPERAALVLAALSEKLQTETLERLSNLGETDSEAIAMLESELAAWVKSRPGTAGERRQRRETVTSILAAADAKTRDAIVARLKDRNSELAQGIQPLARERARPPREDRGDEYRVIQSSVKRQQLNTQLNSLVAERSKAHPPAASQPTRPKPQRIDFDHLIHLDSLMLARLLKVADPHTLALALAGSKDELVERICDRMPKRIAKAFRRQVRRLGPMKLSDVEAAQRAIADLAAKQIALHRSASHSARQSLIV